MSCIISGCEKNERRRPARGDACRDEGQAGEEGLGHPQGPPGLRGQQQGRGGRPGEPVWPGQATVGGSRRALLLRVLSVCVPVPISIT